MIQMPMFQPDSDWKPTPVSQLPSWDGAKRIGIDTETRDPKIKKLGPGVRRGGKIAGISFAIEDGPSYYLPIGHTEDNLESGLVWDYIKHQAERFSGILVGANLPYDMDYLAHRGIWFNKVKWFRDVQIAEPLIDELQMSYSLQAISERHGLPGKAEGLLREAAEAWDLDAKKDMWALPARFVAPYAMWDAELPLKLLRRQERIIDEQDLWPIYDLESAVLPILVKMRRKGVAVDFAKLQKVEDWCIGQSKEALEVVKHATGRNIAWTDVWKASALAPALTDIGVTLQKTPTTGKPSIKKEFLDGLDHPVATALSRARRMNKVVTTFAKSIREHATNGRIHGTFNQLRTNKDEEKDDGKGKGGRFGRLSSSDPNMQQQLARDPELGPLWRSIYIPDEGMIWACLDYSQQEPRWVVDFAEKTKTNFKGDWAFPEGLPRAKEAGDKYRNDPLTDNHTMVAEMCGIERKPAKEIFLGRIYGMGDAKLCHKLNLPTEWMFSEKRQKMVEIAGPEGKKIIKQFNKELPFVNMLSDVCEAAAQARGYITTILGRRCRFPEKLDDPNQRYDWCNKALNRLIQGSSADQTKAALVQLDAAGWPLQLQVHDEVDTSIQRPEDAKVMAEIMRTCVSAGLPFKVDIEIGRSWGEVVKIDEYLAA